MPSVTPASDDMAAKHDLMCAFARYMQTSGETHGELTVRTEALEHSGACTVTTETFTYEVNAPAPERQSPLAA